MKLNALIFEQTHRYLSGQLRDDERVDFLAQLETNAELEAEVETQRQIKTAYQINEYKAQLTTTNDSLLAKGELWQPTFEAVEETKVTITEPPVWQIVDEERSPRRTGFAYYAMAASVAVIIGWYVFRPQPDLPGNTIARQNTNHKPPVHPDKPVKNIPSPPLSGSTSEPQLANRFDRLFDHYFQPDLRQSTIDPNEAHFSNTNPTLAAIERLGTDTTAIMQGIILLQANKTKQAIAAFEPTISCVLPDWQANARWFLALAYLKQQQPDKARPLLKTLADNRKTPFKADAKALLDQL